MRMYMLNKLREASENDAHNMHVIVQSNVQQMYPTHLPATASKLISKHKYWNKVSKKNKLQLLMDYVNRMYTDKILKTDYSLKLTIMLNNGDLNDNECVEFDYVNNKITKLNFDLSTLNKC